MLTHMAHICAHIQSSFKHVLDTPDLVPVSTEYQPVRLSEGVGGTNDQGTGSGDSLGLLQADSLRSKPRLHHSRVQSKHKREHKVVRVTHGAARTSQGAFQRKLHDGLPWQIRKA